MAISRVGSVADTATSVTLPAHLAGDLIIAFAYRDGNNTAPSLPTGWTNITTNGSNTNSFRLAYKLAASSSETATGFTSASKLICVVYRGVDQTTPVGVTATASTAIGTTISYNGATLQITDGTSWVVAFAGHRSGDTALETAVPTSMALVVGATNTSHEAQAFDTGGGVASYAATTGLAIGGTSSGWYTTSKEIRAASVVPNEGDLDVTESPDTAALSGSIGHHGTIDATEAADTFAATGLILSDQEGDLEASEAPDTMAAAGFLGHFGIVSAIELPDGAALSGSVSTLGTMAASENQDVADIAGRTPTKGILAATEPPDGLSGAGIVPYPPITSFLQRGSPGPYICLYQLDLTDLGGDVLYFTDCTRRNPTTGAITEIRFDGETYTPIPIMATGFEKTARGPLARPRLQIGNVNNLATQLLRDHEGLLGARLVRIRTLAQYLDDGPMPDPGQVLPYETYVIARKVEHNKIGVAFELRAAIDLEGVVCPKRVLLRQCSARYRVWNSVTEEFEYDTSDMACPYTDSTYFDATDALVTNPALDVCSQTVTGCKARFGEHSALPFIGFPGAARARG